MAAKHFARVEGGVVVEVIVADQNLIDFLTMNFIGGWVETSKNTRKGILYKDMSNEPEEDQSGALRKNYAGIGMIYDEELDAFYWPKPTQYPSHILESFSCTWVPPITQPDPMYVWDEPTLSWVPPQTMWVPKGTTVGDTTVGAWVPYVPEE